MFLSTLWQSLLQKKRYNKSTKGGNIVGLLENMLKSSVLAIYGNVISGKYEFCALNIAGEELAFYNTSDTVKNNGQPMLKELNEKVNVHEVKSYEIKDVYDAYETTITWNSGENTVIRTEKKPMGSNVTNPIDQLRRVLAKSK